MRRVGRPSRRLRTGTALVGSFGQAAQVFRPGGVTVEATNSHASYYFTSNQVAIRARSDWGSP